MSVVVHVLQADPYPWWTLEENSQRVRLCGVKVEGKERCYLPNCSEHAALRPPLDRVREVELHRIARRSLHPQYGFAYLTKDCPSCLGTGHVVPADNAKGWKTPEGSWEMYVAREHEGIACPNIMCDNGRDRRSRAEFVFDLTFDNKGEHKVGEACPRCGYLHSKGQCANLAGVKRDV